MVPKIHETLQEKLKTVGTAVTLFLALSGVVISLFNYVLLNKLQPFNSRLSTVEASELQVKKDLEDYQESQSKIIEKLATKEQVSAVSGQLNTVADQVKFLYERSRP